MRKILVINAKGGAGKTTVATNLASYFSAHGYNTVLFDHDPQASSVNWLKRRPSSVEAIHGIAVHAHGVSTTRSWHLRVPMATERVVIDTPAGIKKHELAEYLKGVDTIVVPVIASVIDIDASVVFIEQMLKVSKMWAPKARMMVIANRIKPGDTNVAALESKLAGLDVEIVAHFKDSINYLKSVEQGLGIHELPNSRAKGERRMWKELIRAIDPSFVHKQVQKLESVTNPIYCDHVDVIESTALAG